MDFSEFLEMLENSPAAPRITLAWETLPALDGTLHAVDPDPDKMVEAYAVSLCNRALVTREATVEINDLCTVCIEISHERQAEFDAEVGVS